MESLEHNLLTPNFTDILSSIPNKSPINDKIKIDKKKDEKAFFPVHNLINFDPNLNSHKSKRNSYKHYNNIHNGILLNHDLINQQESKRAKLNNDEWFKGQKIYVSIITWYSDKESCPYPHEFDDEWQVEGYILDVKKSTNTYKIKFPAFNQTIYRPLNYLNNFVNKSIKENQKLVTKDTEAVYNK